MPLNNKTNIFNLFYTYYFAVEIIVNGFVTKWKALTLH